MVRYINDICFNIFILLLNFCFFCLDLFAFIIKMPTMHRLSVFRDDIVFLIYLYQRWIYRVDTSRPIEK